MRDRAILASLLYHGMRREELWGFSAMCKAIRAWCIFRVRGKRGKVLFVPVHAMAERLIEENLALAGHGAAKRCPSLAAVLPSPHQHEEVSRPGRCNVGIPGEPKV